MSETRWFVTRYGVGVQGKGSRYLGRAMRLLQRKLHRNASPLYHRQDHPKQEYPLPEMMKIVKKIMADHKAPHKEVIRGTHYDEPAFSIIKMEVAPSKSPLVSALEPYVGHSSYQLGGSGPPGPSDCSGSTAYAAEKAYKVYLPHSANEQGHMPEKFIYFTNTDDLQSGDFIFYKYTNRVGSSPDDYDHVDLFVRFGISIGSRPSTSGIGYYQWVNGPHGDRPDWAALKYGRLRAQ